MSKNEPAFPHIIPNCQEAGLSEYWPGLTVRDWFAGMALQGFLADGSQRLVKEAIVEADRTFKVLNDMEAVVSAVNEQLAFNCYKLADAMLEVRKADER